MKHYKYPENISLLFSEISNNYDLINVLMTFGLHKYWNKQLLQLLSPQEALLDLCAGTGDIALQFLKKSYMHQATLVDISQKMLEKAAIKSKHLTNQPNFIIGDVHALPFSDNSFSFITMAYGLRNLLNPEQGLNEIYRILKQNGKVGILELTQPKNKYMKKLHRWHFVFYIRLLSKIFSKNKNAYKYLENSIYNFLSLEQLSLLYKKNFHIIAQKSLLNGVASIWILEKQTKYKEII